MFRQTVSNHPALICALSALIAAACSTSDDARTSDTRSGDAADSGGSDGTSEVGDLGGSDLNGVDVSEGDADDDVRTLPPAGDPYAHVVPEDVGVTIGAGSVGPMPTAIYDGPTEITEPTTIENVVIDGCLRVQADDVVIRNVIINCDGLYPIQASGDTSGMVFENSRIDCGSRSKAIYITSHADATIRNNEITGCEDFFFIGGDVGELLVENNYMHTLNLTSESHADGFQIGEAQVTTGTITIRGNLIDPDADGGKTDVVFATNFTEADIILESNYFYVWGLRTIRCDTAESWCAVRYNVYDDEFRIVETSNGKRMFLLSRSDEGSIFECNRYPDGSFVVEDDIVDRVGGATHVTEGCPELPGG